MAFKLDLTRADQRSAAQAAGVTGSALLIVGAAFAGKGATKPLLIGVGLVGLTLSLALLSRQCPFGQRLRPPRGTAAARCVPA
jgi:hypothetical protein